MSVEDIIEGMRCRPADIGEVEGISRSQSVQIACAEEICSQLLGVVNRHHFGIGHRGRTRKQRENQLFSEIN